MIESQIEEEHIQRVRWIIEFSQCKKRNLTDDELTKIRKSLWDFLSYSIERPGILVGEASTQKRRTRFEALCMAATEDVLLRVQRDLKFALLDLACTTDDDLQVAGAVTLPCGPQRSLEITNSVISAYNLRPNLPFEWRIAWDPMSLQDQALYSLFDHLVGSRIVRSQLRICDHGCHRLFLCNRKPRSDLISYCSAECAHRAAIKAYRAREAKSRKGIKRTQRLSTAKQRRGRVGADLPATPKPQQKAAEASPTHSEFVPAPLSIANPGQLGPWEKKSEK